MPDDQLPRAADVAEINLNIKDSLKSCRWMVANYRAMIRGEANDNFPEDPPLSREDQGDRSPDAPR